MGNVMVWIGILGLGLTISGKSQSVYNGVKNVATSSNFIPWVLIMGAAGLLADSTEGKAKPLVQSFVVLLFLAFIFSNKDKLDYSPTPLSKDEEDANHAIGKTLNPGLFNQAD